MGFVPAPGICQAELVYNWDSQICETVLQFQSLDTLTPVTMVELGGHLITWWDTYIKAAMPTTLSLLNIKCTDMTTNIGPVVNVATGLPKAGTGGSPSLPNNCALVLTKRTALRGRSYRGRIYTPGLVESIVTGNTVTPATVASIITNWERLISFTTTSTTWDMVVMSRVADGVDRVTADSNQVVSLDSDGIVDSQRRRLPRRGA